MLSTTKQSLNGYVSPPSVPHHRGISDNIARQIENKASLDDGVMDIENGVPDVSFIFSLLYECFAFASDEGKLPSWDLRNE